MQTLLLHHQRLQPGSCTSSWRRTEMTLRRLNPSEIQRD